MQAMRILLTLSLAAGAWTVLERGIAQTLVSERVDIGRIENALEWDPTEADYYFVRALLLRDHVADGNLPTAISDLSEAVRLNPYNWRFWLELGRTLELTGAFHEAETAYLKSLQLNPISPQYQWRFANFLVRTQRTAEALPYLKRSVEGDSSLAPHAFVLMRNLRFPPDRIASAWPEGSPSRRTLLHLMTGSYAGDPEAGRVIETLWDQILRSELPGSASEGFFYIEYLLEHHQFESARESWCRLARTEGYEDPAFATSHNWIWQGDFEKPFFGAPLSWNLVPRPGLEIQLVPDDRSGHCLEIRFTGEENLEFGGIQQRTVVAPGEAYRFSFVARSDQLTTDRGPYIAVSDFSTGQVLARSPEILKTTPRTAYRMFINVPRETHDLKITLRRERSSRIDNQIRGVLWIDDFRLESASSTPSRAVPEEFVLGNAGG